MGKQPGFINTPGDDLIIVLPNGRTMLPELRWMRFEVYIRMKPDVQGGIEMCWPVANIVPEEVTNGS